tara:strand:- start:2669 stop:4039 length:1371 start_codon:yes stop_codon:yes gene_type:complete
MKKLISLFFLIPFFSFSQSNFEIITDDINYDSLDRNSIVPFLGTHISSNQYDNSTNSFLAYGIDLNSNLFNKLRVSSRILNIEGDFNTILSNYIDSLGVYPGMNKIEEHLNYFSLKVNYRINKNFSTRFGKGTTFIGNGYRSMLLSSNHTPYPYFTFVTEFWKVKYYNHFTTFYDIYSSEISQKKHGAFHYLDYELNNNLTIGLFEAIIWQSRDENFERGFDIHYLNPIIFYRPVEFSKYSPDNALLGVNLDYQLNKVNFYCQLLIDDLNINRYENTGDGFFQNKLAFQIGLKSKFNFKQHKFHFLSEYNQAQPYTYAHKHPMQNYTHMNQALAHPLGANFKENIFIVNHNYKKWSSNFKYTYAVYGADSIGTHYGQNIFISDFLASGEGGEFSYGNFNGQGVLTRLHTLYAEINYDIKFAKAFAAFAIRNQTNQEKSNYLILGIKTNFINPFIDF